MQLGPHLADSHAAIAAAHRSKGNFLEGLEAARKAIELEPRSYVANRVAGLCCMGLRRYDDAIKYFERAVEAMESDFTAAVFIVQSYQAKHDQARTRAAAARADTDREDRGRRTGSQQGDWLGRLRSGDTW